jgi:GTP cyclohydrolase I
MTRLTVDISNKKSEKAVKAVLEALGLSYDIEQYSNTTKKPLNKAEQRVYNNLKNSLTQIKLHQEGKIELQNAKEALAEIEASLKS